VVVAAVAAELAVAKFYKQIILLFIKYFKGILIVHKFKLLIISLMFFNAHYSKPNDQAKISLFLVPAIRLMIQTATTIPTIPQATVDQADARIGQDSELYARTSYALEIPTVKYFDVPTKTKKRYHPSKPVCQIPKIYRTKLDPRCMGMTGARQNYNFKK